MSRPSGKFMHRLPFDVERARRNAQIVLVAVAVLAAGGAGFRYVSTRGISNPLRAAVPTLSAVPPEGPVGMHPFLEVDGWPRGAVVRVELCAQSRPDACVELGETTSPGRIRSAPIPATLADGAVPVEPGSYELRATAADAEPVVDSFRVVPFSIGSRPEPRSYAGVEVSRLRLGNPTEVARGGPCSAHFLPDGQLFLGRSVLDPRTAVSTDLSVSGAELAWSPRGDRLAIVTDDRKEIRIAQPDGSGAEAVTREARGLLSSISWAPDADHIAFVARPEPGVRGGPARPTAFTLDLTTGERTQVAPAEGVAWSPAGDRLALEVADGGGRAIHVVDLSGQGTRLADGRAPAWSPDGSLLAFVRGGETGDGAVTRADAASVVILAQGNVCGFAFSADGSRVVVVTRTEGGTQVTLRSVLTDGS